MIPSRNPKLILLVGPPGSGKSTLAKQYESERFIRINQDDQGKKEHLELFEKAIKNGDDIIIDRLNFNLIQRQRYLSPAKIEGYDTKIIVLHENSATCMSRMKHRTDHPTIKDERNASQALNMFMTKYERVQDNEADEVVRVWPDNVKTPAIICDLDGTLANIDHRLHFVKQDKKDWKGFFGGLKDDKLNHWCAEILNSLKNRYEIVYCSGRPDDHRDTTINWLTENDVPYGFLYMRRRGDFRQDNITKEVILEFELLTRYDIKFCLDDRTQVVEMWRKHGLVALQVAKGDF